MLNPSLAQAKDPPTLSGPVTLTACPAASGGDSRLTVDGTGSVGTTDYTMNITQAVAGNTYDFRARYSYIPTGSRSRVFAKARDVLVTADAAGNGSYAGDISVNGSAVRIYRLDIVDVPARWTTSCTPPTGSQAATEIPGRGAKPPAGGAGGFALPSA